MTWPWEQVPTVQPAPEPPSVAVTVELLQRDLAYMVTHTAVLVRSKHEALTMLVNTPRGQIIPAGPCKLSDGSTFELQDIGMPQPKAPLMTVKELLDQIWDVVQKLGLEIA